MGDLDRIIQAVCSEYGQQRHALLSRSRGRKPAADARMVAMYLATRLCPSQSLTSIGRFFNRDRATVRHARNKVSGSLTARVEKLEKQIGRTITPV